MSSYDSRILPLLVAALLFFSNVGSVRAVYCVDTGRGYEECSALSPGARIGVGIAIAFAGLLLIFAVGVMRQRRNRQQNLAYVNNSIGMQGSPSNAPPGYYQAQGYNPQYPQYPAPAHGYDPRGGFAPPYQAQAPPQYTPPPGPPPEVSDKTRPLSQV
ncbi:hypothetical protein DAEQUDRAFT_732338 [Daedalea quercina L-15889]|uniref:Uncharacterized protein n=1 Tax=Daedalea quercina L-15889 TaxID=1314783 RepID=A0A165LPR4_9APHY|nr:hypothetical protein DAEQUDRAFT_732338 [Daedalea quercina L-15889]